MSEVTIPEAPISRIEQYFNYLATGDGALPEYPISRKEQYLAYLCAHRSDGAISILNKNGEVITTTAANVQTTATQYIVTNYGRQPKTLDGLVLTITDAGNDKVLYVYSSTSSAWVNVGVDVDLSQYFTKAETTALLAEKADLVNGIVPSSQLPSYVSTIVEVNTYEDLPATGASNTIYVVKNENNQQYRWGGTTYIPVGDEKVYYAVTVVAMTTMGELKAYVDGINSQALHILLDLHNYITDAYVCSAHFYEESGVYHCEIFDLLNSQYVGNPAGFVSTDTIASFCNYKYDVATKPTIKTVLDATLTPNTMYFLTGNPSAVSFALPTGTVGDIITVAWYNGSTAATLTITGASYIGESYTPAASKRSELNFLFDGTNWCMVSNEMAVS